jgi:hypothetical protein
MNNNAEPKPTGTTAQGLGRRRLLQLAGLGTTALAAAAMNAPSAAAHEQVPPVTTGWDKTFPKNAQVRHQKVSFTNRVLSRCGADRPPDQGRRHGVHV